MKLVAGRCSSSSRVGPTRRLILANAVKIAKSPAFTAPAMKTTLVLALTLGTLFHAFAATANKLVLADTYVAALATALDDATAPSTVATVLGTSSWIDSNCSSRTARTAASTR